MVRLPALLRQFRYFDFVLLVVILIMILFGIMMIASATNGVASLADRVRSQIIFSFVGVAVVFIVAAIDYRLLTATYIWIYGVLVLFLAVGAILGVEGEAGSQSWINLGVAGFQPSELAKILLIVVLAKQMANNTHKMNKLTTVLVSLGWIGIPAFFIFIQPDLGITLLILFTWFIMIWGAGLRWQHLLLFVVVALIALPVVWGQMEPYQQSRIIVFINPDADRDAFFNIGQALTAIGNGGLLGRGYMQGSQSQLRFLRVRHTDFIFAVIAEEFGFVGAIFVLVMMLIVLLRILRAAHLAQDMAGSLICYGVGAILFFQTLVSIGMNIQLMPVTGLTLPFISSGGSSLVTLLLGIGLVQSVLLRQNPRDIA
ncbi:MAG: rod shape-determining protein RodA [Anaerolineae bacterium]|nr:rod shape-determining protein RodA [Anaerolineae bacterium]